MPFKLKLINYANYSQVFSLKPFILKKYSKMGKKKSKKSIFSDSKTSTTMMISALDRTAEINLDVLS